MSASPEQLLSALGSGTRRRITLGQMPWKVACCHCSWASESGRISAGRRNGRWVVWEVWGAAATTMPTSSPATLQVHVNLLLLEARMQAALLYALRAITRYMT